MATARKNSSRVSDRKTVPDPLPGREILNIDEAAAFLGVSVKTFSKVLREEDVPGRKVGREWKFSRQALIDWVGEAQSRDFLDTHDDGAAGLPARDVGAPARRPGRRRRSPRRVNDGFSVDEL